VAAGHLLGRTLVSLVSWRPADPPDIGHQSTDHAARDKTSDNRRPFERDASVPLVQHRLDTLTTAVTADRAA